MSPMKFGIHGSCVTRDMFGFLGKEEFLGFYQARSSLSTKGPHRKDIDTTWVNRLRSPFQRRMVDWDVSRRPLTLSKIDAMFVDLIDERFPVFETDIGLVTGSKQFKDAGGVELFGVQRAIDPEYRHHAFSQGCKFLRLQAEANNIPILFHESSWATEFVDESGNVKAFENQDAISDANEELRELNEIVYDVLKPSAVLQVSEEHILGDSAHRWGAASFHYVKSYYEELWKKVESIFPDMGN